MVMIKALLTYVFIVFAWQTSAQKVKIMSFNSSFEKYRASHNFDYLHADLDSSKFTWVADYLVEFDTVIPGMIGESYKKLKEKANKYGANGFKVKESDIFKKGRNKHIIISVYWIRMEHRGENLELHKDLKVYLFGFLGHHLLIDGYQVKIQDESITLHSLTYRVFAYPSKTDVIIQLGSKSRGAKTSFKMEEGMYPKFFYFNMVKGSFKNAWIDEYSLSFGLFLTEILEKE
jgi:hypothetical protein